jgi:hypothetical protein
MLLKTLALAAAISMGAIAMAQAGDRDRADDQPRGYRIGPMGQVFGGRPFARMHRGYYGYAYAPRRHHRIWVD